MFHNRFSLVNKTQVWRTKTENAPKNRILCVEDNEDTCELLSLVLSEYDFTFAHSLAEAKSFIENDKFDLFILDNWLPDGNGLDFCRQIREFDKQTPIILISGLARDKEIREGLAAGVTVYFEKPFDFDELKEVVKELINKT